MENASLVGLSRQVALRRELDVISNNVANINTTGFKADGLLFVEYLMPKASDDTFMRADRPLSFVEDRATVTNFAGGDLQTTGGETDVAIDGEGFFVVESDDGPRYTRSGAMQTDGTGFLVTSDGHRVLTDSGPIKFAQNESGLTIGRDGTIATSEGVRGKLRVVKFESLASLRKAGGTTFSSAQEPIAAPPTTQIVQGSLEKSNVRAIAEMSRLVEVTRSYASVSSMLDKQDDIRRSAIERLADVPA